MEPTDDFFSGRTYAVLGARAAGRAHGPLLIAALGKAGKTVVAIEPEGSAVKGAVSAPSLMDAGPVDGAVVLPPVGAAGPGFAADALAQCAAAGVRRIWVYPADKRDEVRAVVQAAAADAVVGPCPCLYVPGGGFPHNLHRWIERVSGRRRGG